MSATRPSTARFLALAATVGLAVAVAVTWPLACHLRTGILDDGTLDGFQFAWNLWWVRESLVTLHQLPFRTHHLFYPDGVPLVFHTGTFALGFLSLPLQLATADLGVAYNLVVLLQPAATVVVTALLARELVDDPVAATAAGFLAAVNPLAVWMAPIVYLSATWVIAGLLLLWMRLHRLRRRRDVAYAVAFVPVAVFTSQEYAMIGLALVAVDGVVRAALAPRLGLARLWGAGAAAFVATIGVGLGALAVAALGNPAQPPPAAQVHVGSAYLLGLVSPPWLAPQPIAFAMVCYLGTAAIVLGVVAVVRAPRLALPGVILATAAAAMALGPYAHVWHPIFAAPPPGGDLPSAGVPGPYLLAQALFPLLRFFRSPFRWMAGVNVALACVGAVGVRELRRRHPGGPCALVLAALLAFAGWADTRGIPGAIASAAVPRAYDVVRDDPEPCAVMTLPAGLAQGGFTALASRYMYYQTVHRKFLLDGTVSRLPPGLRLLSHRFVRDFAAFPYVKYLVVHRDLLAIASPGSVGQTGKAVDLARRQGELVAHDETTDVYRLRTFRPDAVSRPGR